MEWLGQMVALKALELMAKEMVGDKTLLLEAAGVLMGRIYGKVLISTR